MKKFLFSLALLISTVATKAQVVTFNIGFENPPYTVGFIGAGNFEGQDHWTGFGYQFVTNSLAHSGSQSLITTMDGFVSRRFDNEPSHIMSISKAEDWYMEAWAYVLPGSSSIPATFEPASGLGGAFYISVYGDGRIDFNSGAALNQRAANPNLLNKWLRLRIEHPAYDLNLEMSIVGDGVNETFSGYYNTPWNPSILAFGGPTAFWDDVYAVSGALPAVPEPSTAALVGLGLLGLGCRLRRR